jgi:hypothetical protein
VIPALILLFFEEDGQEAASEGQIVRSLLILLSQLKSIPFLHLPGTSQPPNGSTSTAATKTVCFAFSLLAIDSLLSLFRLQIPRLD